LTRLDPAVWSASQGPAFAAPKLKIIAAQAAIMIGFVIISASPLLPIRKALRGKWVNAKPNPLGTGSATAGEKTSKG
jgi:hypothetical protein